MKAKEKLGTKLAILLTDKGNPKNQKRAQREGV